MLEAARCASERVALSTGGLLAREREQAEATVPKSIERWGATEAQVIPAKVVLVEGTAAA